MLIDYHQALIVGEVMGINEGLDDHWRRPIGDCLAAPPSANIISNEIGFVNFNVELFKKYINDTSSIFQKPLTHLLTRLVLESLEYAGGSATLECKMIKEALVK